MKVSERTVVVVNPAASNGGAAERWPGIRSAMEALFTDLTIRMTEGPGHATELCREALEGGAEMVVSVGGDGTNNETLCGFMDEEGRNRFPDAVLGVVASGTGGDFQRQFGVVKPARQVERLVKAQPRTIDYGVARFLDHDGNEVARPFLNMTSVGISGLTVRYVSTASRRFGPKAAYVSSSIKSIVNYRNQQVVVTMDDGPSRRLDLTLMIVGNGQYFGAGMWACPHAQLDDGFFDTILMEGMRRSAIVGTLGKVFNGKHLRVKNLTPGKAKKVRVDLPEGSPAEVLVELDGEQPGKLPATFEVVPAGLRVRVA